MPERNPSLRPTIVFAFALGLLLYVLWVLRDTVLLIYIGILFAMIFTPAVQSIQNLRIRRWSPGRGTAIFILLGMAAGVIALVAFFIVPPIVGNIQEFLQDLPAEANNLADRIRQLPFGSRIVEHFNFENIPRYVETFLQRGFTVVRSLAGALLNFSLILILTIYFILDGPRSFEWAMSLFPAENRVHLRQTLRDAQVRVHKWLTGQLLLMLALGGSSAIVLGILHVRYFYALALFAGIANFVPVIGPTVSIVLAGSVAAFDSWLKMLIVVIFYLVYLQVENVYLAPRIMQSTIGLPGVAVIVALAIGGALAGVLGALVAVPSAALLATLMDEYMVKKY
jgi:predicted PurR-regulated permease PerM